MYNCTRLLILIFCPIYIGLTELGGVAVLQERGHNNHESCGIVTKDTKLKIVDVDNNSKEILGPNEKGEILLKQTYMMKFYFQNSKATQEAIDDEGAMKFIH